MLLASGSSGLVTSIRVAGESVSDLFFLMGFSSSWGVLNLVLDARWLSLAVSHSERGHRLFTFVILDSFSDSVAYRWNNQNSQYGLKYKVMLQDEDIFFSK